MKPHQIQSDVSEQGDHCPVNAHNKGTCYDCLFRRCRRLDCRLRLRSVLFLLLLLLCCIVPIQGTATVKQRLQRIEATVSCGTGVEATVSCGTGVSLATDSDISANCRRYIAISMKGILLLPSLGVYCYTLMLLPFNKGVSPTKQQCTRCINRV